MAATRPGDRHVVLLRGINVGGKHRLPMAALVALLEEAGAREVRTYIQSGNAVIRSSAAVARRLPVTLQSLIRAELGFEVPVVLRSAKEFLGALEASPFPSAEPSELHLGFLRERPTPAAVRALDANRGLPDEFAVRRDAIWLRIRGSMARTKLTSAWFDRGLGTVATFRNHKTVSALSTLLEET